jgi:hypothetical protein
MDFNGCREGQFAELEVLPEWRAYTASVTTLAMSDEDAHVLMVNWLPGAGETGRVCSTICQPDTRAGVPVATSGAGWLLRDVVRSDWSCSRCCTG